MTEYYLNLPVATSEQEDEAMAEANRFMASGGNTLYCSVRSTARAAIFEYILFTKGVKASRKS